MLLAGLMAVHVGAFAAWLAAGTAAALLEEAGAREAASRLARLWAPAAMLACLASGVVSWTVAYPVYRGQGWVWAKLVVTLAPAAATTLQAAGRLSPRRSLRLLWLPSAAALLLAFARPF